ETIWKRTRESLYTSPMSWIEAIHPEDREIGDDAFEHQCRGESTDVEYRILQPDGAIRWIRDRGFPITDHHGQVYRLTGVAEDITAKKEVEVELQRSYAHFHALVENTSDIICVIDAEGIVSYYSPSVERVLGYRPEAVVGKHVFGAFHPDDVPHINAMVMTVVNHPGHTRRVEYRARHRDGSWRDFEAMASSPPEGLLRGEIVVHARDITERKQAEEALRKSEAQFRQIAENMRQVLWMSDPHTRQTLYVSPAHETIWGSTCENLYAEPLSWLEAIHLEDREIGYSTFERQRRGESTDVEYRIIRPDGTMRWIRDRAFPIRYTSGQVDRIAGIAEDITERKQAEEERQRLENQLRQSQKVEAIGTLTGGIAHDFNNVLGAIFVHTEVAKTRIPPGSGIAENLQNVLSAAGRAKELVQQILTFSRQVETPRQPVQLTSLIPETLKLLRASLPTTIDIRYAVSQTEGVILANPTQIHQIVLNLCTNAEYAMRETGGILEIHLDMVEMDDAFVVSHSELQTGPHMRLTIRDSGHGMTPEIMERIFDPYFTTKGPGEGTGMGLAIVHGMVSSHGGAVTVESTPGMGTTFVLYFPCTRESVSESPQTRDGISPGTGCIMVVDDEPMLADGMKVLLTQLGYEVVPYTSSQEAIAAFEAEPEHFDLVITDQTMPYLTGEQLARELRHRRADIPIILCTGFSHMITAESAREQGIDAYCMKPMSVQELSTTIQQVLEQRPVPATPPKRRILLIDDDDQLRGGVRHMLESEGYEIVEARNGKEGFRQYQVEPADLVITDILMPEQEGVKTIQELRRDFPDVRIVAISGGIQSGHMNVLDIARRLGAQRTLQKPFSRDELMIMIRDVLQG
ncbi:MAG: PAS domain-containing protein, partial [Candidatus Tectomicrobia bacterium]|nr:PAS domain-containing protein [Candidatus Tectomicrobia bacterium]